MAIPWKVIIGNIDNIMAIMFEVIFLTFWQCSCSAKTRIECVQNALQIKIYGATFNIFHARIDWLPMEMSRCHHSIVWIFFIFSTQMRWTAHRRWKIKIKNHPERRSTTYETGGNSCIIRNCCCDVKDEKWKEEEEKVAFVHSTTTRSLGKQKPSLCRHRNTAEIWIDCTRTTLFNQRTL